MIIDKNEENNLQGTQESTMSTSTPPSLQETIYRVGLLLS